MVKSCSLPRFLARNYEVVAAAGVEAGLGPDGGPPVEDCRGRTIGPAERERDISRPCRPRQRSRCRRAGRSRRGRLPKGLSFTFAT